MGFLERIFSSANSLDEHFLELTPPAKRDEIRSLSLYCDCNSYKQVAAAYDALLPDSSTWAVQYLNPLLDRPEVKEWLGRISMWKALASQMRGEIVVSVDYELSPSEATFFPRIAFGFSLDERLSMVTARKNSWVFIRMGAFRNAEIGSAIRSPDSSIDIKRMQTILTGKGWRALSFP